MIACSASNPGTDRPAGGIVAREAYVHGMPDAPRERHLAGVLRDTLGSPGSLTRLQLGWLAGRAVGLPSSATRAFATALEYFHTASLLLDDMPCMDDASLRRGRACAHLVHGEGSTVLGALAFINRAYRLVWDALSAIPDERRQKTAAQVERCLGATGVLDGQSLDLHFAESDRSGRAVSRVALGKTVCLLRLSLVTPAIMAGTPAREQLLLDRLSVAWGLAYQIADDVGDMRGCGTTGKTQGRDAAQDHPNFVVAVGYPAARHRLSRLLRLLDEAYRELVALRATWADLGPLIDRFCTAAGLLVEDAAATRCA